MNRAVCSAQQYGAVGRPLNRRPALRAPTGGRRGTPRGSTWREIVELLSRCVFLLHGLLRRGQKSRDLCPFNSRGAARSCTWARRAPRPPGARCCCRTIGRGSDSSQPRNPGQCDGSPVEWSQLHHILTYEKQAITLKLHCHIDFTVIN